jgi:hypothetical protein
VDEEITLQLIISVFKSYICRLSTPVHHGSQTLVTVPKFSHYISHRDLSNDEFLHATNFSMMRGIHVSRRLKRLAKLYVKCYEFLIRCASIVTIFSFVRSEQFESAASSFVIATVSCNVSPSCLTYIYSNFGTMVCPILYP